MRLQTVLPDTFRVCERGLDRHDACGPHFCSLLDDEIGARLFDRCENQPQIRRHLQRLGLLFAHQLARAFACFGDDTSPLAILTVKQKNRITQPHAHHPKEIVRLITIKRNRLPFGQRLFYIQSDFCLFHGHLHMVDTPTTPEPAGQVSDAVRGNWVDHLAPAATRPYLRLSRADRPIGTWLLLLPCWMALLLAMLSDGQYSWFDLWIAVGCAIGAFVMRGAGCTWNDITDRDFDAQVERTRSRPIPSGQVSAKQAAVWLVVQALIGLCVLLTFNTSAILLGVLSLVPVAVYPFAKRFTWWPQVFLGIAFNWGALLAWTAHTGSLGWPAVVLYLAGIAWTLFYDTIYAHQDTEDDALIGVKSTARLFAEKTPQWLQGFLIATVSLMALAVVLACLDRSPLSLVVALAGPWAMGWHMQWQMRKLDTEDNHLLMMLFRANRDTGFIPLLFFAAACFL
ncbi:4-hydroxybenzoate octaprenyltransferase [Rhodobacteraceae bacterium 4F10]|nr:4-hydroxybenzoate octaprenyltransferase [Rhodobacteraceae bacterium 4F10]